MFIGGSFTSDRVSGRKELLGLDTLNFVQDIRLGTAARVELGVNVEDDFNTDEDVQLDPAVSVLLNRASTCLLYTSPSPRDLSTSRMPSSA